MISIKSVTLAHMMMICMQYSLDISHNTTLLRLYRVVCFHERISNETNLDSWEAEALLQFENYVNFDKQDHHSIPAVKIKTGA